MITPDLIKNRIENFFGYGSLKSPVWFIGMEERFDSEKLDENELEKQFNYAIKNSIDGVLDVKRSEVSKWKNLANMSPFLNHTKQQKTWRLPINLYLYLKSNNKIIPSDINIIDFQINKLCDSTINEVSTLELSSLPAFSTKYWNYDKYRIPGMETRNEYYKNYLSERAEKIKKLVNEYKPKLVIFYSSSQKTHLPRWIQIIGKNVEIISDPKRRLNMYFSNNEDTSFCIIPQPIAGVSYEELYEYADKIRGKIKL